MSDDSFDSNARASEATFHTTRWSWIRTARGTSPEAREALEALCRAYWYPLYAFLRRKGDAPEDAADLVQGLFSELLERWDFERVEEAGGRFRSYLLAALVHHAGRVRARAQALKRGGDRRHLALDDGAFFARAEAEARYAHEPVDGATPERLYERRFATALLAATLSALRAEEEARAKGDEFRLLEPFLEGDPPEGGYAALARTCGKSEGALKVAAHRLRRRWRQLLIEGVARQVARPQDVEDELRALFAAVEES